MTTIDRLPFTGDDEADRLLVTEPLALLIGFELDQQVTVQKAFSGPAELKRRLGHLDAAKIAAMEPGDLDAVFRTPPALHRFPGLDGDARPGPVPRHRRRLRRRRRARLVRGRDRQGPRGAAAGPAGHRRHEGQDARRDPRRSGSASGRPAGKPSSRPTRRSPTWTPRRRSPPTRPASAPARRRPRRPRPRRAEVAAGPSDRTPRAGPLAVFRRAA